MKVLLVGSEPDMLEQSKMYIEEMVSTISIDTLTSFSEVCEKLEEDKYGGLVFDCRLIRNNYTESFETLRRFGNSDISIIVFGSGDRDEIKTVLNMGADRYFQKRKSSDLQNQVLMKVIVEEIGAGDIIEAGGDSVVSEIVGDLTKAALKLEKLRDDAFRRKEKLQECVKTAESAGGQFKETGTGREDNKYPGYEIENSGRTDEFKVPLESLSPGILALYRFEENRVVRQ